MATVTGLDLDKELNEKVFSSQSLAKLGAKLGQFITEIAAFMSPSYRVRQMLTLDVLPKLQTL